MLTRFLSFTLLACLVLPAGAADVIFGRRDYATEGRSYQQIESLDLQSKKTVAFTRTERRHMQPVCSPDARRIWFLSGAFGDERDTELWWFDPATRTEKLALTFRGRIMRLLGGTADRAFFLAFEGGQPGLYRWDGSVKKLSPVPESVSNAAALSPDARTLAVQTGEAQAVTMMEPSGAPGRTIENCAGPVWSADGRKLACVAGSMIRVINLATGVEAVHAEFTERATPPSIADFSPDGTRLLVRTVGANHNSTFPQSDYWILEAAAGKWTFVGPGQSALFGRGGTVLLVTPRELSPIGKGKDWVSQLLVVDVSTHAQTPVAPGRASNVEPCRCATQAAPARKR